MPQFVLCMFKVWTIIELVEKEHLSISLTLDRNIQGGVQFLGCKARLMTDIKIFVCAYVS